MTEDIPDILKREDKAHYEADAAGYFRNVEDKQRTGRSAEDVAARHLPSDAETERYADRVDLAVNKSRRSGAIVDHKKVGHGGLFLQGLKETSELIDQFTPGKYTPEEPAKPPEIQKKPTGWFPKPDAVLDRCPDCMELVGAHQQYVLGMAIVTEEDSNKLLAMKVSRGGLIVYSMCVPCFEAAKELARDQTPLVLVFGGGLTDEKDIAIANKYGFPISYHEGSEKTKSQWDMILRAERVQENIWGYLRSQPADSPIFRPREKGN